MWRDGVKVVRAKVLTDARGSGGKATWIEPVEFLVVRSDNERIVNPLRDDPVERPEYVG